MLRPGQLAWGLGSMFALFAVLAVLIGSAGTVNHEENFPKIQSGMEMRQVIGLMGSPSNENQMARAQKGDYLQREYIWHGEKAEYHVFFVNGRVMSKYRK
jgi:hypothetical protein